MKRLVLIAVLFCSCLINVQAFALEKLVILGSGPAGLTASLFAAQAHLEPLVIEGYRQDGQIATIYRIENYPGFPEGISGIELSERMKVQAENFGVRFVAGKAQEVNVLQYPFVILLDNGATIECESLIIATGASPKPLGLKGELELMGRGVSTSATLDADKFQDKKVVIVGGGDTAMEQALHLAQYASHVKIVYKASTFYGAKYLQERIFSDSKIDCEFNAEIVEISGLEEGHVNGVCLRDVRTAEKTFYECAGLFVSNGRKPNTELFAGQLEMNEAGYILTKPNSTQTDVPGVFVAGDITTTSYNKVTTAAASGCMAATDAARFHSIRGK